MNVCFNQVIMKSKSKCKRKNDIFAVILILIDILAMFYALKMDILISNHHKVLFVSHLKTNASE